MYCYVLLCVVNRRVTICETDQHEAIKGTKMKMKSLLMLGVVAGCLATAGQANAENLVLFSGATIEGGVVNGTLGGGVSKIYSVKAKGDVADITDLTTNYYIRVVDNVFQVTNFSKSIIYLGGEVTDIFDNSYTNADMDSNGPLFLYTGRVDYSEGTWLSSIRNYYGYDADMNLHGNFRFSGTASSPRGAEVFSLNATGVPEPGEWAAMGMMVTGLAGLVIRARRRLA